MASISLLRAAKVEHVTLAGESTSSRVSLVQHLPDTVRADVREQTSTVRLPDSVILFWRLLRWRS
jgi:hypothetical protein